MQSLQLQCLIMSVMSCFCSLCYTSMEKCSSDRWGMEAFIMNPRIDLNPACGCYSQTVTQARGPSTHLGLCRRGRQTSATCSETAGWGRRPEGRGASGWQTAPHYQWGNWVWQRRCAEPHRRRSRCSWTSCRRIRRWRTPRGRTVNKLWGQKRAEGH